MLHKLIEEATKVLGVVNFNSYYRNYSGRVACALVSKSGTIYTGVSVDLVCGLGNCAEYSAICEMVKHHETEILMIVSIYEGGKIVTPCGRCRELMFQIDTNNIKTRVVVDEKSTILLGDLLPMGWNA